MKQGGGIYKSPVAKTVPADGSNCDLVPDKTQVQDYLDALCEAFGLGVSPGYQFGREGQHSAGTWLIGAETTSNKRGLPFGLVNGSIEKITVATRNNPGIYTVQLWYHDGNLGGATLLGSVTTAGVGSTEDFVVSFAVPQGKQLAAKISATSGTKPKETGVFLVVKGDLA